MISEQILWILFWLVIFGTILFCAWIAREIVVDPLTEDDFYENNKL